VSAAQGADSPTTSLRNSTSQDSLQNSSLALLAFDGEIAQVTEATRKELQPLLSENCLDLWKLNAGLSFLFSACDAGRTHSVLHFGARLLRHPNKPFFLQPQRQLTEYMKQMYKKEKDDVHNANGKWRGPRCDIHFSLLLTFL
jgi:hypothetical protein